MKNQILENSFANFNSNKVTKEVPNQATGGFLEELRLDKIALKIASGKASSKEEQELQAKNPMKFTSAKAAASQKIALENSIKNAHTKEEAMSMKFIAMANAMDGVNSSPDIANIFVSAINSVEIDENNFKDENSSEILKGKNGKISKNIENEIPNEAKNLENINKKEDLSENKTNPQNIIKNVSILA